MIYAATFLCGAAFSCFQPYTEKNENDPILNDFNLFVKELHHVFGDSDQSATAERELQRLKQTSSTASYASEFRRLSVLVEWNDAALCNQFYLGLKNNVKDYLVNYDRPNNLA